MPADSSYQIARFVIWLLLAELVFAPSITADAASTSASNFQIESLIDRLTLVDKPAPGLDPVDTYDGFIATGKPLEFAGGILGEPPPVIPIQMRELVQLGITALPALIAHLTDRRPTRIVFKRDDPMETFGGMYFKAEYSSRFGTVHARDPFDEGRIVKNGYTVKIGDVCYVLIGQIVNRRLLAVRYQPSSLVFINSPLESPQLIDQVKRDWGDLDARSHTAQLIADLRAADDVWRYTPALERLRFYYPAAYDSLRGADLQKRLKFEAAEASKKMPN
jgi:hypothetical protein